jgi:DNA primase
VRAGPSGRAVGALARQDLAERAGVDASVLDRLQPRDRRADLLQEFFDLCRQELASERDPAAKVYLQHRGFPRERATATSAVPAARTCRPTDGFLDLHQLRTRGIENVAALGGTSVTPETFERLHRLGVEAVTLCLDNDDAGRAATARAIDALARAGRLLGTLPPRLALEVEDAIWAASEVTSRSVV